MADAKLTALTAASALAGADLFYISQGGVSKKATHTQLLTLVGTEYVAKAGGTMTGALTIASGTLTASAPALNVTQTWNDGAVAFSAIKANVTATAAAAGSLLLWLQSGGNNKFTVGSATGVVTIGANKTTIDGDYGYFANNAAAIGFGPNSTNTGANDTSWWRDAAGVMAIHNSTTQQTIRLYNTKTDASNYERLTLTGVAGTSVNITAETLGTGGDNLDIVLTPAGTGRVDQINGTTAQTFRVFNTYTNSSNGEWGALEWNSNRLYVRTNINGTGVARSIQLDAVGAAAVYLGINGGWKWGMNTSAGTYDFSPDTTNSYDIGLTAKRVRSVYVGTASVNAGYAEHAEMTAPAAPATNSVRIYAEDNGAGKTRLMALFATGSAVQIAIEP